MIALFLQLFRLTALLALLSSPAIKAAPAPDIRVQDQDGTIVVDITYHLPVNQRIAWEVLTDFDAMADFVPNMERSRILERDGKRMIVEQKGQARVGILSFSYDSKREIELTPYQTLHSRALSGTKINSTTTLAPAGNNATVLSYRAIAVPDLPVPSSVITSSLSDILENQFKAMEQEMESRAKADKPANPLFSPSAQTANSKSILARTARPSVSKPAASTKKSVKKRPG